MLQHDRQVRGRFGRQRSRPGSDPSKGDTVQEWRITIDAAVLGRKAIASMATTGTGAP
jgi:hypothetical protein